MFLKYTKLNEDYSTVRQVLKQEFHISSNLLTDLRKTESVYISTQKLWIMM